jgi:hypothetical protein
MEGIVQTTDMRSIKDTCNFEVQCSAGKAGGLHVRSESLSVQVGQCVLREGAKEIWHSLTVLASEDEFGSLVIRVLVFNPDWEEPIQIASITSRPHDPNCRTTLGCNLNHVPA